MDTTEDTMVLDAVGFETTKDTVAMGMMKVTDEDMHVWWIFYGKRKVAVFF